MNEKTAEIRHAPILDDRVSGIMDAKEGNRWQEGVQQGAPLLTLLLLQGVENQVSNCFSS